MLICCCRLLPAASGIHCFHRYSICVILLFCNPALRQSQVSSPVNCLHAESLRILISHPSQRSGSLNTYLFHELFSNRGIFCREYATGYYGLAAYYLANVNTDPNTHNLGKHVISHRNHVPLFAKALFKKLVVTTRRSQSRWRCLRLCHLPTHPWFTTFRSVIFSFHSCSRYPD